VDGLGPAAVAAAVLAALSPALFFYSRYYIQEMLLVCFTFGVIVCGYRYARTRALPWAVAAGICAGLMHATKETAVIALGCLFLAAVLVILPEVRRSRSGRS
jgi:4-amino-4-deoxy-L-arabinose transferase-like glycosyltransferase